MRTIRTYFYIILMASMFTSCETDVVLKELKTVKPQLVIEGSLTDQMRPFIKEGLDLVDEAGLSTEKIFGNKTNAIFKLTETSLYYETKLPKGKSGAKITVTDNKGTEYNMSESIVEKGIYLSNKALTPLQGEEYKVKVEVDGNTYTHTAKLPKKIDLKGVKFEPSERTFRVEENEEYGDNKWYDLSMELDDLKEGEFVKLTYFKNAKNNVNKFILYKGGTSLISIAKPTMTVEVYEKDTLTLALYSINKDMYKYYRALQGITGGGPPSKNIANPPTNWNGNEVLGHMLMGSLSKKTYAVGKKLKEWTITEVKDK